MVWLVLDVATDWKLHKLLVLLTAVCWLVMENFWRVKARGTRGVDANVHLSSLGKAWLVLRTAGFYYLPLSSVPVLGLRIVPEQTAWLGLAMCIAGIGFAIWARHALAGNWNISGTGLREHQVLIQSGPYTIVRHPIYSGMLLAMLGTGLVVGKLRAFVNFVFTVFEGWTKLNQEEACLQKQFPDAYAHYQLRVKKLIPGIL